MSGKVLRKGGKCPKCGNLTLEAREHPGRLTFRLFCTTGTCNAEGNTPAEVAAS